MTKIADRLIVLPLILVVATFMLTLGLCIVAVHKFLEEDSEETFTGFFRCYLTFLREMWRYEG